MKDHIVGRLTTFSQLKCYKFTIKYFFCWGFSPLFSLMVTWGQPLINMSSFWLLTTNHFNFFVVEIFVLHYSDKCLCWYFGMLESTILLDTDVRRDVFSSPQKPRDFSFNVHNAQCTSRDHGESLRHPQILWSSGMQFSGGVGNVQWTLQIVHCTSNISFSL